MFFRILPGHLIGLMGYLTILINFPEFLTILKQLSWIRFDIFDNSELIVRQQRKERF